MINYHQAKATKAEPVKVTKFQLGFQSLTNKWGLARLKHQPGHRWAADQNVGISSRMKKQRTRQERMQQSNAMKVLRDWWDRQTEAWAGGKGSGTQAPDCRVSPDMLTYERVRANLDLHFHHVGPSPGADPGKPKHGGRKHLLCPHLWKESKISQSMTGNILLKVQVTSLMVKY